VNPYCQYLLLFYIESIITDQQEDKVNSVYLDYGGPVDVTPVEPFSAPSSAPVTTPPTTAAPVTTPPTTAAPVTTPPTTAAPVPSCASKSMSCTVDAECCSNFCGIVPLESGQTSIQTSVCRSVSTPSKQKVTDGNRGGARGGTIVQRNGGGRKLIRGSKN
jgi:hypothetical protein